MTRYVTQTSSIGNLVAYTTSSITEVVTSSDNTWVSTGLTITPPIAGTYLCLYSASMFCEGAGATIAEIDVQNAGVSITNSIRQTRQTTIMVLGLIGGNNIDAGASNCMVTTTVDGSQAISVRFRKTAIGTTVSLRNRSLTLIRIG